MSPEMQNVKFGVAISYEGEAGPVTLHETATLRNDSDVMKRKYREALQDLHRPLATDGVVHVRLTRK